MKPISCIYSDVEPIAAILGYRPETPVMHSAFGEKLQTNVEYTSEAACLVLVDLLTHGAQVVKLGWEDVVVELHRFMSETAKATFTGKIEDLAQLRNIARLYQDGADPDALRHFVSVDSNSNNYPFTHHMRVLV